MDYQDLLYTNRFISNEPMDEARETKNHFAFQKYMLQESRPTSHYLQNATYEENPINLQQSAAQRWPAMLNKNA